MRAAAPVTELELSVIFADDPLTEESESVSPTRCGCPAPPTAIFEASGCR
jgi:hypothetical protein